MPTRYRCANTSAARARAREARRRYQSQPAHLPQPRAARRIVGLRAQAPAARAGPYARARLGARTGRGNVPRAAGAPRQLPHLLRPRRLRHAGRHRRAGSGAGRDGCVQGGAVVAAHARHGEGGRAAQHRRGASARLLDPMGQTDAHRMNDVARAEVEDFLYHEAALLDAWRLDEWLALLTDDATYRVPSNDQPDSDPKGALFTIADDMRRIRARVARLKDPHAHAESPRSRTRRLISNVRIVEQAPLRVEANFIVYRYRGNEDVRTYVGRYRYTLVRQDGAIRIKAREAILDAMELASLGTVSFIL